MAPLLLITAPAVALKRRKYLKDPSQSYTAKLPVVVVGNITVGGTGKSPMVIALAKHFEELGLRPGIVSRGHKRSGQGVELVCENSSALDVGDEPLMLYRRTGCPVAVCAQRVEAIKALEDLGQVDVIISDDGLQHYKMGRDVEIAMIDSSRQLGNGMLLPVGPLREPPSRLRSVDFCFSITSGGASYATATPVIEGQLGITRLVSVHTKQDAPVEKLKADDWLVLAGIGNPDRFALSLQQVGLPNAVETLYFPDHHDFQREDIPKGRKIVMTEKDAVKIEQFATENDDWWYVSVALILPLSFKQQLTQKIEDAISEKNYE